jgi:hypothetical protein
MTVVRGMEFPMTAMTRDDGDGGDLLFAIC